MLRAAAAAVLAGGFLGLTPAVAVAPVGDLAAAVFLRAPDTKPLQSFDISWVDSRAHQYYLADRSNNSVDIVDTASNLFTGAVPGFVGATPANPNGGNTSGPNGVVVTQSRKELWAGDGVQNGTSWVRVVNLETNGIISSISTGGKGRADEIAYDNADDLILVANDAEVGAHENPCPFLSFISTRTRRVLAQVVYDAGLTTDCPAQVPAGAKVTRLPYAATDGLEQPVYDPTRHTFFQAVPLAGDTFGANGEVDQLDPRTMTVVKRIAVSSSGQCHPQGLVMGLNGDVWAGCSPGAGKGTVAAVDINPDRPGTVVNGIRQVSDGVVATVPLTGLASGQGADEIWLNLGDHRLYMASSAAGQLAEVNVDTKTFVGNIATGVGSHSVAADARLNHILVPLRQDSSTCKTGNVPLGGCIGVIVSGAPNATRGDQGNGG